MPRVSEAHLAARRQQILDAARVCFARNGFHATSMHDVIAEAGLSVGAVYRYFKSKDELVTAIAQEVIGPVTQAFGQVVAGDPPPKLEEALRRAFELLEPQMQPGGIFPLAIQVWAESFRNPTLATFVKGIYTTMRTHFTELARRAQASGELPPDVDPEAVGGVLFGLVPGFGLQRVLLGEPTPAAYLAGFRALHGTPP